MCSKIRHFFLGPSARSRHQFEKCGSNNRDQSEQANLAKQQEKSNQANVGKGEACCPCREPQNQHRKSQQNQTRQKAKQTWPDHPIHHITEFVKTLPPGSSIGDFGSEQPSKLALSVLHNVRTMEMMNFHGDIICCDLSMSPVESGTLDAVVFCLTLRGNNLAKCMLEANRVLRTGGFVLLAEINTRFDRLAAFTNGMKACGFKVFKKELLGEGELCHFFRFKKARSVAKEKRVEAFSLKSCIYRAQGSISVKNLRQNFLLRNREKTK